MIKPTVIETRARLYVDGACVRNGQPNARMGAGVVAYLWPGELSFAEAEEQYRREQRRGPWPVEGWWALGAGTNNRAELLAVLLGIGLIPEPARTGVTILTDSEYVQKVLRAGAAVTANHDLIAVARSMVARCGYCRVEWVRGHDRCAGNLRADELATAATNEPAGRSPCPGARKGRG